MYQSELFIPLEGHLMTGAPTEKSHTTGLGGDQAQCPFL